MNEKILAFLKTKLNGVPNAILEGASRQLATVITEEAQIETVCNAGVILSLQASSQYAQQEGDRRATTATQTAIQTYEEKHKIKDGKLVEAKKNDPDPAEVPEWAKTVLGEFETLKKERETATKVKASEQLIADAKKLAKDGGATDDKFMAKALKLASVSDGMTAQQLADAVIVEYNELRSMASVDSASPFKSILGDKTTIEAAQKTGVAMVDQILGKPKE